MTNMKILKRASMNHCPNERIGEDVPFGPPPEEYSYRCSRCGCEIEVNEVIIDLEIAMAESDGTYYKGFMPIFGCPDCNQETMEYCKA